MAQRRVIFLWIISDKHCCSFIIDLPLVLLLRFVVYLINEEDGINVDRMQNLQKKHTVFPQIVSSFE